MRLNKNDFNEIATIHKSNLKNSGFLGQCSIKFISFFYEKVSIYKSSIMLVEKNNQGKVIGFCFFSEKIDEYYKKFFFQNFLEIIFYTSIYFPLTSHFRRKKKLTKHIHKVELVQIAVDSRYQGKRIGAELIKKGENILLKKGISQYYLQVFAENNIAIKLYQKIGFYIIGEFEVNNREKYLMKKSLK